MKTYGLSNIVVHAPYIINIANTTKPEVFNLELTFYKKKSKELKLGAKDIVLHPGAHVGAGVDKGIKNY